MDIRSKLTFIRDLEDLQRDLLSTLLPLVEDTQKPAAEVYIRTIIMKSIENTLDTAYEEARLEEVNKDDGDLEMYASVGAWWCTTQDVELQAADEPALNKTKELAYQTLS
jgi:hypothetical protein